MAPRRNKGFSARQSQRMSRRMEDSTLGSHVRRSGPSHASRRANASSVSFSSGRESRRAARGEVPGLMPQSTTRESAGAYRTRVQQMRYMEEVQRRAKRKRILLIVGIIAVLLVAAGAVGCMAFMGPVGSPMALRASDAAEALTAPKSKEPYYALISVELGSAAAPLDNGGPDALLLALVDAEAGKLSLVDIPGNTRVLLTDNQNHAISELAASGDAALINEVEKLAEVEIAHYAKIDEKGLADMVDALGGIAVNVAQDIDDPHAGPHYIPKGEQTLSGKEALTFLRATNLRFGEQDRMSNQLEFAASLLTSLFSSSGTLDFAGRLDAVGSCFQTDYSSGDLMGLASAFGELSAANVVCMPAPGYMDADLTVESTGQTAWVCPVADMRELARGLEDGSALRKQEAAADTSNVSTKEFTIEVQNGTELVGAAAATADELTAAGFYVVSVGNADQPIYDETLLTYHGENGRAYAQKVVEALGIGRVVDSSEYYSFDADVLVILGSDSKPSA